MHLYSIALLMSSGKKTTRRSGKGRYLISMPCSGQGGNLAVAGWRNLRKGRMTKAEPLGFRRTVMAETSMNEVVVELEASRAHGEVVILVSKRPNERQTTCPRICY
jgi:hypothetical protein